MDRSSVMEEFRAYLRDHNLPVTAQRQAIAEVILASDRHLSVEEIEHEVSARGVAVGTATVYRTIEVLLRSGLVVDRDFGEGFKRYEPARGIPQHEHLLCTVCGNVTEFRDERLDRITTLVAEANGFARRSHRLVIVGVCQRCQAGQVTGNR